MKNKIFLASLLPAGLALLSSCGGAGQKEKPNVVFIISDDLGIGDLSCYGATKVHTPNIDRLASQGAQFMNTYSSSSVSTPSRFCLLTGKYPWRQDNTGIAPGNAGMVIDTAVYTMADLFKECGYATAAIGKWHLGLGGAEGPDWNGEITPSPHDIGFDHYFVIPATVDRVPCVYVEDNYVVNADASDPIYVDYGRKVGDWPTGKEHPELLTLHPSHGHDNTIINGISRIGYMTGGKRALWKDEDIADTITSKARQFIIANKDNPFFLYMGTQDVHVPRIPHPRFAGKSGLGARGDVILQLDWTVGEIMNTLDSLGLSENTIFVFTSDNGPVLDDGYRDCAVEMLNGHTPSGIYRGGKYSIYEAGTRIPFIVRWPSGIKAGTRQENMFSHVDFFPTMAAIAGVSMPQHAAPDGRPYPGVLMGKDVPGCEYVIQQSMYGTLAVIEGEWKYIEPSNAPEIQRETNTELGSYKGGALFNIQDDPGERVNLVESYPEMARRLAGRLAASRSGEWRGEYK